MKTFQCGLRKYTHEFHHKQHTDKKPFKKDGAQKRTRALTLDDDTCNITTDTHTDILIVFYTIHVL
jgi:hypothetical protein